MKKRKTKKRKTSTVILIAAIANITWFTIAAIILQFVTSVELSSTLITCWYAFWTSEVVILAGIKVTKVAKNYKNEGVEEDDSGDC